MSHLTHISLYFTLIYITRKRLLPLCSARGSFFTGVHMFTVEFSELMIGAIATIIAYGFIASMVGCFKAWVALQMGDDTPVDDGFLTLNPLPHVDIFGFLCFLFLGIGWFKAITIDRSEIHGKYKRLKGIVAFYSNTFLHVLFSFLGILLLRLLFGVPGPCALGCALHAENFSCYYYLAQQAHNLSSFALVGSFILFAFTRLNILLAGLTFAINTIRYLIFPERGSMPEYGPLYTFVISILFLMLVARPVGYLVFRSGMFLSSCVIG